MRFSPLGAAATAAKADSTGIASELKGLKYYLNNSLPLYAGVPFGFLL